MEIASRNRWLYMAGSILIVALAAVVRVRGAQNDLWLDEIWSLHLASLISRPLGIFAQIRYEWVKTFPTAPLSGLHWYLYHNLAP